MNVVPFRSQPEPTPEPAKPEPVESFYQVMARKAIELAGDKSVREVIQEVLDAPLKDFIEAFQGKGQS